MKLGIRIYAAGGITCSNISGVIAALRGVFSTAVSPNR
jgi:hypothetical protein